MSKIKSVILLFVTLCGLAVYSQDTSSLLSSRQMSAHYLEKIYSKTASLESKLDKKSEKVLAKFQVQEIELKKKIFKLDSLTANNVFTNSEQKYKELEQRLKEGNLSHYVASLDSLEVTLKFLKERPEILSQAKDISEKLKDALSKVKELKKRIHNAETIKNFLRERKEYLKHQLSKFGFVKELKKLNKSLYYFGEQVNEYKSILSDQSKLEKKVVELLCKIPEFKKFISQSTVANSLFPGANPISSFANSFSPAISLGNVTTYSGLQSRAQVQQAISQRTGTSPARSAQQFQQLLGQAGQAYQEFKAEIEKKKSEETKEINVNSQKVKSLKKRLEYGANVQFEKSSQLFPARANVGVHIGFRMTDKSTIGLGLAYRAGLGNGWRDVRFSNQGLGFRSFAEFSIGGNLYARFGAELNYLSSFTNLQTLYKVEQWQRSALLGISKKIKIKVNTTASFQLMYDFLYRDHYPASPPIVYRIAYSL